jgi:hypothetical protein
MGRDLPQEAVLWASQSHRLGEVAYLSLPEMPRKVGWDVTYQQRNWPVVATQIDRAGLRLAALLNAIFEQGR